MSVYFYLCFIVIAFLTCVFLFVHFSPTKKLKKQIEESKERLIDLEQSIKRLTQKERFYRSLLHDLEAGKMKQNVFPITIMDSEGAHTIKNLSQLSIFMAVEGTFLFSEYSHIGYDEQGLKIFDYLPKDHAFNFNLHRYLFLPPSV